MTDLRKIAEILNTPHPVGATPEHRYGVTNAQVAALLDALVEERRNLYPPGPACQHKDKDGNCKCVTWSMQQAIKSLDLDGVWPPKEKK